MTSVSILLNLYLPDNKILRQILDKLEEQRVNDKIEIIVVDKKTDSETSKLINSFKRNTKKYKIKIKKVDEKLGFAASLNEGFKESKSDIVVILQQDSIPTSDLWLTNLIEPFKDEKVVATVSRVHYPDELWNRLGVFAKAIMLKEKGTITPALDEKACGYKRDVFMKVGMFNYKEFKIGGEDADMYMKLKFEGKIVYPDATIIHYHPTNLQNRLTKIKVWANGEGALIRKYGTKEPKWYIGILKAIPLLGVMGFLVSYPWKKGIALYPYYMIMSPVLHFLYVKGFWKGFIAGKQNIEDFPVYKTKLKILF